MKRTILLHVLLGLFQLAPALAKENIAVVTTLPDLAAIAKEIGQEKVTVEMLVKPGQDPHHIEVLPSYMMKLRKADIFLIIGMDLDMWAYALRDGSRNGKLLFVDCSQEINRLEIPTGEVNPSHGDIHLYGNPHYWLDPENGRFIARSVQKSLTQISPENETYFAKNLQEFERKLDQKIAVWKSVLEPFKNQKLIFYHNSWPYFLRRFGLSAAAFIEPKPGIPPSPAHIAFLLKLIQEQNIKVIAMEPFLIPGFRTCSAAKPEHA